MSSADFIPTYRRTVLHESEAYEIVSIEWGRGAKSEMHSHGWSSCAISVESGVFKNTLNFGGKTEIRILETGQVLETPVGARHELECVSGEGKTLHVYTPKIVEHDTHRRFNPDRSTIAELHRDLRLQEAVSFEQLRRSLATIKSQSVSTHSPYFMNQLFSGVLPQTLMSEELISHTRTTLATHEASPVFSMIEAEVVERLGEQIGWPARSRDGASVPGGSSANAMAIHLARHKAVPTFKEEGSRGERFRIFVSKEAHYSFKKAALFLGLGLNSVVPIETDEIGRMIPALLERAIIKAKAEGARPLLVGATVGTTVLGSFDPLESISEICSKHSLWLHADAAWGGPALFSSRLREFTTGIEKADSVAFDAHKLFGAGLTCSFILTRHVGLLLDANDVSGADYLFHEVSELANPDRGKLSWQCGRRADAVSFWTVWKSFGTEGLGLYVDRLLDVRDSLVNWIQTQPRLKLVSTPSYLNLCVRVLPPHRFETVTIPETQNDAKNWSTFVREKLKANQSAMVNYSADAEGSFLRLILAHPDLQFEHVKDILNASLAVAADQETR